ncbi:MAG: hypothetical protein U0P45_10340 [Acidimicrobiales bacterium]
MEMAAGADRRRSFGRKVAVVALVAAVATGATVAAKAYLDRPGEGQMCTLGGSVGPVEPTPEAAFAAWWRAGDPAQLPHTVASDPRHLPDPPKASDFVRDGRTYRWYVDRDTWLQVDVDHPREAGKVTSEGWTVVGANRCERVTAASFQPVG